MKGFKVGQTYQWPSLYNSRFVVLRVLKTSIDMVVIHAGDGPSYLVGRYYSYFAPGDVRLMDVPLRTVIQGGKRVLDRYQHYALLSESGKALTYIVAGCQKFRSTAAATRYWKQRRRWAWAHDKSGPDYKSVRARHWRERDAKLNAWSLKFVRSVERTLTKAKKTKAKKTKVKK